MKKPVSDIAFAPAVKAVQECLGSRQADAGMESRAGSQSSFGRIAARSLPASDPNASGCAPSCFRV